VGSIDWLDTLIGAVIGGVISLLVSLAFYVPAARSLEREAARLYDRTTLILRALEEAGLVKLTRDERGDIVGIEINVRMFSRGGSNARFRAAEPGEGDKDAPADQE
jgi:hypothetical protein